METKETVLESSERELDKKNAKRDVAVLMFGVLQRLAPPQLDCALDAALPGAYLRIEHSYNTVPLFDASRVVFVRVPSNALDDATALPYLLRRHGITDPRDVEDIRDAMRQNKAFNDSQGRTAKAYPLAWVPPEAAMVPIAKTEMDGVANGYIYSTATLMPAQQPTKLQHAFYSLLIAYLFSQLPLTEKSEVRYGYHISEGGKLNLFMSVVR